MRSPTSTDTEIYQELKRKELREQVSFDLQKELENYSDKAKGFKALSRKCLIHEKTIKRLINLQNTPGHLTLYKIYRTIYRIDDNAKLLNIIPPIIAEAIREGDPNLCKENVHFTFQIERELRKDPVFREIYFRSAAGRITRGEIVYRFGVYGEEILNKMVREEVLEPVGKDEFKSGPVRATLDTHTAQIVSLSMIETFFKSENTDNPGENYIGLFVDGLDEDTYDQWLRIDQEAFNKKVELAKKSSGGENRVFTIQCTDTMVTKSEITNHDEVVH